MATLRIEHEITDYALWKKAFDRFADSRRASGVHHHRIHHPVDDPNYILIDLDFATPAEAAKFLAFLHSRVWSTPETAPALAGTPRTRILDLTESL